MVKNQHWYKLQYLYTVLSLCVNEKIKKVKKTNINKNTKQTALRECCVLESIKKAIKKSVYEENRQVISLAVNGGVSCSKVSHQ